MAECTTGQAPWAFPEFGLTGQTVLEVCQAAAAYDGATLEAVSQSPAFCQLNDGESYTAYPVPVCEPAAPQPPASAPTIACTASSPCVMHLTQQQTEQIEGWFFVLVIVAMVFAAMHGFSSGQKR